MRSVGSQPSGNNGTTGQRESIVTNSCRSIESAVASIASSTQSEPSTRSMVLAAANRTGHVDRPDSPTALDTADRQHLPIVGSRLDDADVASEVVGVRRREGRLGTGDLDDTRPDEW